jgi:predicted O-methyltransferase YrrM
MPVELVEQAEGYGPPAPVPIFQWEEEFSQLLEMFDRRKPERILEIGTYHGGTLFHWLQRADWADVIVSVDSYLVGVDNRRLYDEWNIHELDLQVIKGDSRKKHTIEKVRGYGPYDWLFIDAGHFYDEVRDDWENYRPMVRAPGVVVFHDILPPSRTWPDIQVWWLWKEIKRFGWMTEELIADPEAEWGGLGLVYLND